MKKEIIIIVAVSKNNVIGKNNKIPWYIKEDLIRFKKLTSNHTVIMGRKTFLSLPKKPLPYRENIVLSKENFEFDNVIVKDSLTEAIKSSTKDKIYIIGGAGVYEEGIRYANRLEITKIHKTYQGDTFFPPINMSEWKLIKEDKRKGYSFETYIRENDKLIYKGNDE